MKGPALLRRILSRSRDDRPVTNGDSTAVEGPALELADIQGLVLRAYTMPMVRHTPADGRNADRRAGSSAAS